MAVTKTEIAVLWAGAGTKSVAAAGNATSDAFDWSATSINAMITCSANNDGSFAAGDKIDMYVLYGTAAGAYDTANQGTWLCTLDVGVQDVSQETVTVNPSCKKGKIYASNLGATRAITVTVTICETLQ